jgi:hypothetical protein
MAASPLLDRMLTKLQFLAIAVVLFASQRAHAQWMSTNGMSFNNPSSALIGTMIQGQMNQQAMATAMKRGTGGTTAPAAVRHQPIAASDFRSSGQRMIVDGIVGGLTTTPAQKSALVATVNQVFAAYEAKVRKNNVAYAMTFMFAAALVIEKGVALDDAQTDNLAIQLNDSIVSNAGFANASAGDRQKVYETFVTMGALMLLFNEAGKTSPDSAKLAKALASQTFAMLSPK